MIRYFLIKLSCTINNKLYIYYCKFFYIYLPIHAYMNALLKTYNSVKLLEINHKEQISSLKLSLFGILISEII